MILLIDNYDSFTYNIVQFLGELGESVVIHYNDKTDIEAIEKLTPQYIVIGPGPCSPKDAGISVEVIQHFAGRIPILGICLGHQSIGYAFGGVIIQASHPMHGKASAVYHQGEGIFSHLSNPIMCTRYHSLIIDRPTLPDCLAVTAWSEQQEIMGIRHKTLPIEGIQFHPEGLLTEHGHDMLRNFIVQNKSVTA